MEIIRKDKSFRMDYTIRWEHEDIKELSEAEHIARTYRQGDEEVEFRIFKSASTKLPKKAAYQRSNGWDLHLEAKGSQPSDLEKRIKDFKTQSLQDHDNVNWGYVSMQAPNAAVYEQEPAQSKKIPRSALG